MMKILSSLITASVMCQKEHETASSGKKNRVSQTTHCFNGGLNDLWQIWVKMGIFPNFWDEN